MDNDQSLPSISDIVLRIRQYRIPLLLSSVSICIIFASIIYFRLSNRPKSEIFIEESNTESARVEESTASAQLTVDISGGIHHPGVYKVPRNSRVEDVIQIAGGLSAEASIELIGKTLNRAKKVSDGAKIYIPTKVDETQTSYNDTTMQDTSITSHNVDSDDSSIGASVVSLNSSSQSELETLPGIGPVTAAKIITNRPYTSTGQLLEKKIIGSKTYEKIKLQISL